jgi:decaprenyl-phosphate phosphoribosyltransferase
MSLALSPLLKLLRPHHWIKSGFVAAPLFFTPHLLNLENLVAVVLGMAAWSGLASAIYIFNDWRDVEADRSHPIKKNRPLAAGTVSLAAARLSMLALVLLSLALALYLGTGFMSLLIIYGLLNLAYSMKLKHIAIVDVMCIALGFVLRVEAGATLIAIEPTPWLIILTGALALFLGFAKRRDDIVKQLGADHRRALHGYNRQLIDTILAITAGAAMVAYLLYTTDNDVMQRLGTPHLYATAPFVIFALLRYLQITMVEERSGSPTLIFLTDKPILLSGLGWLGTFAWLIYG